MKSLKHISLAFCAALAFGLGSCSDEFLDQPAIGALSDDVIANQAGLEKLLVGAYAALDGNQFGGGSAWEKAPDNWVYGSVAGGDASKGSFGGDQRAIDPIAKFEADASNGFFNSKWRAGYEGINRTNAILKLLPNVENIPEDVRKNIEGQARFLRGHYYFDLKKMFNMVPWIDENTENLNQPNDKDIWPMIEADFLFAYENLPTTQPEAGRANNWAAAAYLAKTYLYQKKYNEASPLFTAIVASGQTSSGEKYGLMDEFHDNFNPSVENNKESVFAIQMTANDGTNTIANANEGGMLNFPYNSPFRCCGFYQPTQDLVNAYKTNPQTGLPYLDNWNNNPVKSDMGVSSGDPFTPYEGSLDPRLDWTVGRRGLPYLDWGHHPGANWIRDQSYAGPYAPKKNIYWQATEAEHADQSSWAPGTAINVLVIRYADVLLMAAEVEANLGNVALAREYVNQVRRRAANPQGFVYKYANPAAPMNGFSNVPAANYVVAEYSAADMGNTEDALKAIYFERRLELAMEGHRFFDLVRWGIAESSLNSYFAYQGSLTSDVRGGRFVSGRSEYYPIPLRQIDLSVNAEGVPVLKQNPGYN